MAGGPQTGVNLAVIGQLAYSTFPYSFYRDVGKAVVTAVAVSIVWQQHFYSKEWFKVSVRSSSDLNVRQPRVSIRDGKLCLRPLRIPAPNTQQARSFIMKPTQKLGQLKTWS